jgi:hypothetical protein
LTPSRALRSAGLRCPVCAGIGAEKERRFRTGKVSACVPRQPFYQIDTPWPAANMALREAKSHRHHNL